METIDNTSGVFTSPLLAEEFRSYIEFMKSNAEALQPAVIAIHGKAGSGKTHVAGRIVDFLHGVGNAEQFPIALISFIERNHHSPLILAFADALKEHLYATDRITPDLLVARQKNADYRKLLTSTADTARATHGSEYFAKTLCARVIMLFDHRSQLFIVHDLRYRHQLSALEATGFNLLKVHIHAPQRVASSAELAANFNADRAAEIAKHDSETDLDAMTATREEAERNGFIWFDNDPQLVVEGETGLTETIRT